MTIALWAAGAALAWFALGLLADRYSIPGLAAGVLVLIALANLVR